VLANQSVFQTIWPIERKPLCDKKREKKQLRKRKEMNRGAEWKERESRRQGRKKREKWTREGLKARKSRCL